MKSKETNIRRTNGSLVQFFGTAAQNVCITARDSSVISYCLYVYAPSQIRQDIGLYLRCWIREHIGYVLNFFYFTSVSDCILYINFEAYKDQGPFDRGFHSLG